MIKLDENFYLDPDSNNWTLHYELKGKVNPETGRPKISKDSWHCSNLQSAINRYLTESTKPSESVVDLMNKLEEIKQVIINLKIK